MILVNTILASSSLPLVISQRGDSSANLEIEGAIGRTRCVYNGEGCGKRILCSTYHAMIIMGIADRLMANCSCLQSWMTCETSANITRPAGVPKLSPSARIPLLLGFKDSRAEFEKNISVSYILLLYHPSARVINPLAGRYRRKLKVSENLPSAKGPIMFPPRPSDATTLERNHIGNVGARPQAIPPTRMQMLDNRHVVLRPDLKWDQSHLYHPYNRT